MFLLLLIKLGFLAAYSVILCEDSSSTLWICPFFSLLWFNPLIQGRFVYPDYRRFVSIVFVWIRPLWLTKLGFMAFINLRLDIFWHKKEAAASTVCLTGFPCRFFRFFLLLLIKVGFMAAYAVILFEHSSSTLWIRPLFSLLWFYPLSQDRFVYPNYRRFVSIVFVWIFPLWLIKLGFMALINLHLDLFWHKKEAAASTVCLTGFPCHFF